MHSINHGAKRGKNSLNFDGKNSLNFDGKNDFIFIENKVLGLTEKEIKLLLNKVIQVSA